MNAPRILPLFEEIVPDVPALEVIDIGANPAQHELAPPHYQSLFQRGRCRVTGFEPGEKAFAALREFAGPQARYFPYAIGDGTVQTLHECEFDVLSSLYEPNAELLRHFHLLDRVSKVVAKHHIETKRLDDIAEIESADYIHMDVQGAELQCLQGGEKLLRDIVVAHIETNFLPMYKGQPLFSEVELYLRSQGFMLHRVDNLQSRTVRPLCLNGDALAGWRQWFWGDSVFIRDITTWHRMKPEALLKMAAILHELYHAFDLVQAALMVRDGLTGRRDAMAYLQMLSKTVPEIVTAPKNG